MKNVTKTTPEVREAKTIKVYSPSLNKNVDMNEKVLNSIMKRQIFLEAYMNYIKKGSLNDWWSKKLVGYIEKENKFLKNTVIPKEYKKTTWEII